MDGLLSPEKTPYRRGGAGKFYKIKSESQIAYKREGRNYGLSAEQIAQREQRERGQLPMPSYASVRDRVEARVARHREINKAISHFAGISEYPSNQSLRMPPTLPLPRRAKVPKPVVAPWVGPDVVK